MLISKLDAYSRIVMVGISNRQTNVKNSCWGVQISSNGDSSQQLRCQQSTDLKVCTDGHTELKIDVRIRSSTQALCICESMLILHVWLDATPEDRDY